MLKLTLSPQAAAAAFQLAGPLFLYRSQVGIVTTAISEVDEL